MVYFITGRAGAGKTTLAYKMKYDLKKSGVGNVLILDGDEIRKEFPTGFSDQEREDNIMRIAKIAKIAEVQDIIVIIAMIAPTKLLRMKARKLFKKSELIYLPHGKLWEGTSYEEPDDEELKYHGNNSS